MDRELLIEIGVEELPAAWLPALTRQLAERVGARLTEYRIAPGAPIESFSTPRRLTAHVAKIAERQEDLDPQRCADGHKKHDEQGQGTTLHCSFERIPLRYGEILDHQAGRHRRDERLKPLSSPHPAQ